jgi:hypothetical protein
MKAINANRSLVTLLVSLMLVGMLVALPVPKVYAVAVEHVVNGGFENDFNGWINSYSEISTTVYHSGLKSCCQTYSQNVYQYFSSAISIDSISNFTCWIKKGSGDGNEYVLFYTTGISGNYLIGHGSAAQDWHKVDLLTAYAGSGSTGDLLGIGFVRMDDNFVDYWIDDVTLLTNFGCAVSPDTASFIIGQTQNFTCNVYNGSSPYTYQWYQNGTTVGTNSFSHTFNATQVGFFELWCNVIDSTNSTVKSNVAQVTVTPHAPNYSDIGHNTSQVSQPCTFSCKWSAVGMLDHYVFSLDNGVGSFTNTTGYFTANPQWANETRTLTSTPSATVRFMWKAFDVLGSSNSTPLQVFTTTPSPPPTYSNVGYTSSTAGSSCVFHAKMTDAVGLSEYIFSFDNGLGMFSNASAVFFTGNPAWANTTKTLTSVVGATVRFKWFFDNTQGVWGATPIQTFTTTGNYPPSITGISFILDSTDLGTVSPGEKRAFNMTFRFDGQTLVFQDIQFKGNELSWFQKPNNLPQTYMKNIYSSALPYITVVVQVPSNAVEGSGTVQATAYAFDSFGTMLTSSAPVTFTVQNLPFPFIIEPIVKALTQLIRLLGNPLILLLLVATVVWFGYYTLRKKRR